MVEVFFPEVQGQAVKTTLKVSVNREKHSKTGGKKWNKAIRDGNLLLKENFATRKMNVYRNWVPDVVRMCSLYLNQHL